MMTLGPLQLQSHRPLVAIVGPTAVGKSDVAIRVAQALGTEILSADSRQVYRGMDIGTDKPSAAERQRVTHRLLDLVNPDEPFNAGLFRRHALVQIERLYQAGALPLVVGGTGLYVRVLLHGLWNGPAADWSLRRRLEQEAATSGATALYDRLCRVDPRLASRLHPHDRVKIIRGLEVVELMGRPLSDAHDRHRFSEASFTPLVVGLQRDRPALYRRIEARVERQLDQGLVDETRRLLTQYGEELGSMKGLGYRQIAGYLAGRYDYPEAVRQLKRDTRHFAKRQMTWFRKEPVVSWLTIPEGESAIETAARVRTLIERFLERLGSPRAIETRSRIPRAVHAE